jgi:hypothetical protein
MNLRDATPEVLAMGEIDFIGHIIPHYWFKNIRFENGKVDLVSINILSEICYWYRPTIRKDEATGQPMPMEKKFHSDALQRNKSDLADLFGLTERQVQESLARLEKLGLITRDYRTVKSALGIISSNVLYIKIHPEKIKAISIQIIHSYDVQTSYPSRSNVIPTTLERHTYTENTAKSSKEKKKKNAALPAIEFNRETSQFENISDADMLDWQALFPGIDISRELLLMRQWLLDPSNPKRDGNRTFITNWLKKPVKNDQKRPSKLATQETLPKTQPIIDEGQNVPYNEAIAILRKSQGEDEFLYYLMRVSDPSHYHNYMNSKTSQAETDK